MICRSVPDHPLVSVVTPSLNQGRFIEQAIDSVLQQSYGRIEHIVVDGGSTDSTIDVLRRRERDLARWVSEADDGHADAVNKGWRMASGDILAFLNADDYYLSGAIERIVDEFAARPYLPMVHGQGVWVDVDCVPLMTSSVQVTPDSFCRTFPGIPQPASFVARWVVDEVGPLDPTFDFALDGEFFSRILGRHHVRSIPEVLAALRMHAEAKSSAAGVGFSPEVLRIASRINGDPASYPLFDRDPDSIYAAALMTAARFEALHSAPGQALRHLLSAAALGGAEERRRLPLEVATLLIGATLGGTRYRRIARYWRTRHAPLS